MHSLFLYFTQCGRVMLVWLKYLSGLRLPLLLSLLVLTGMVSSCGTSPLSLLTGGGPNVAANTQVAKTASQTVGTTKVTDQKITNSTAEKITQSTDTTSVKTDKVEEITINNLPNTFVMLLVLWSIFLWQLPSPNAMGKWVRDIFKNYLTFKNKS